MTYSDRMQSISPVIACVMLRYLGWLIMGAEIVRIHGLLLGQHVQGRNVR